MPDPKSRAAKRQILPMVGTVFLHLKGATTLSKCTAKQFPFFTFYQTGCDIIRGIFIIPMIGFGKIDFFSFHTATKEKKQKNVALFPLDFVLMLVKEKLYSVILWLIDKVKQMETIQIKGITLNDIEQLQQIGRQTFYETFSAGNTEENMTNYLNEGFSIEKLTIELSDKNAEFYFATLDNTAIGYLKLNFGQSQTELQDDTALEIERIYVLKEFHGKKVGQILYEKAIEIAKKKNANYVWLGVWEENPRAISFYKKNGFVEFDKHIFKLGDDEQTDIMMKLKLA
ncbi:ribosomal protein S18 acetylase RimI-like enzyme [Sphingobacterium alimentarium]|uniref:Ribosomal protein S18 acetylase RimI-like enzyme n=3 Tax=Bacteroidota TaxID=976 RepID=A0A4R3W1D3_9SPHI|nr:ribosomal protein S18 acetylase RimI-like enzyme [Sphingobacterium alimentarium]